MSPWGWSRGIVHEPDADTPQHYPQSPQQRSGPQASRRVESEAMRCFRSQSRQFDQGTRQFMERYRPTSQELIAMATRKSQCSRQCQNNSRFIVTSLQLAPAKQTSMQQVNTPIENYGGTRKTVTPLERNLTTWSGLQWRTLIVCPFLWEIQRSRLSTTFVKTSKWTSSVDARCRWTGDRSPKPEGSTICPALERILGALMHTTSMSSTPEIYLVDVPWWQWAPLLTRLSILG